VDPRNILGLPRRPAVLSESELLSWSVTVLVLLVLISALSLALPSLRTPSGDITLRVLAASMVVLFTGGWLSFLALRYTKGPY
jgi:ABC-type transport system involved in multi-copper enzyme maturation permease subunit